MKAFSSFLLYWRKTTDTESAGEKLAHVCITNTESFSNRGVNSPCMVVMVNEDVEFLSVAHFDTRKALVTYYRLNPRTPENWGEDRHGYQYRLLPEE